MRLTDEQILGSSRELLTKDDGILAKGEESGKVRQRLRRMR